ncbi:hypothetical protein PAECIP111890_02680 [Paenibacillus sp. JJ-223]|nr:hypothetical protein PAECIP111890_02680 [Paenibacillus sp. JJ-223]
MYSNEIQKQRYSLLEASQGILLLVFFGCMFRFLALSLQTY